MLDKAIHYIRNFFTPNRLSISICILLAAIGWFLTKMSKEYNHQLSLQMHYQLPGNQSFSFNPPSSIEAEVRGKGWSLLSMAMGKLDDTIYIDQSEIYDRIISTRSLLSESLKSVTSDELTIINASPEQVQFQLVERQSKKVPIRLDGEIVLANQYQYKEPYYFEPDSVVLYGAQDQLNPIESWPTTSFSQYDLDEDLTRSLDLLPAAPAITTDPSDALLIVNVDQVTEKEIYVPIQLPDSIQDQVRIFPHEVLVKVTLGLSQYDEVSPDNFKLALEIDTTQKNRRKVIISELPKFVTYISHDPQYVDYYRSASETNNSDER